MPVDKTKPSKSETTVRRARGELACAECRRLKLKCDKQTPCSSCIRRGCSTICPNGILAAGQGTRFILSDTQELHRKVSTMSERIRQLEDALRVACPNGHPLLAEDLLTLKHVVGLPVQGPSVGSRAPCVPPTLTEIDGAIDALNESLGTLVIGEGGSTVFIGTTGAAANVLVSEDHDTAELPLPPSTRNEYLSEIWPFYPFPDSFDRYELLSELLVYLPTKQKVSSFCEALFENLIWTPRILSRSQVIEEVMPAVYGRAGNEASQSLVDLHDLALLFMICALGSLADLTQDPRDQQAFKYYTLARTAVSIKPVFEDPTLTTIQVLHLMNEYVHFQRIPKQEEVALMTYSMMVALAIRMGLHRDPSRWNLDPALSERRRTIFWQIFWTDSWKSLSTGRPAFFSIEDIDCTLPALPTVPSEIEEAEAFRLWFFRYGRDVIHPIAKRMVSAKPLKHSEVLEFDRQIREYPYFPSSGQASAQSSPARFFWATAPRGVRNKALLYIHRPFFAKAMLMSFENPANGPYAASFLCTYTSAISILKHIRELYGIAPDIASRCWFLWPQVICYLIVISSVVTLKPNLDIVPEGLSELALLAQMFEQATGLSDVLKVHLPTILRLRTKAFEAYAERKNTTGLGSSARSPGSDFSSELALLSGQTRSVYIKCASTAQKLSGRSTLQAPPDLPAVSDYSAPSGLASMMSPPMFTNHSSLSTTTNLTSADNDGLPDAVARPTTFLDAPTSYPIPTLQALNDGGISYTGAPGTQDVDTMASSVSQDTWNDLLGFYQQDGGGSSDLEWFLPETLQDWT